MNASIDKSIKINVDGTKNVLDFALECKKTGRLKSVNYISTIGAALKKNGCIKETYSKCPIGIKISYIIQKMTLLRKILKKTFLYSSIKHYNYVYTKYIAEKIVRNYQKKGLRIPIFRPSAIVGDSETGEISNFSIIYQLLNVMSLGLYSEIPIDGKTVLNLIPVDSTAEAIYLIADGNCTENKIYNIVHPSSINLDLWVDTGSKYFRFKKPEMIPVRKFKKRLPKGFRKKIIELLITAFNSPDISFEMKNTQGALENTGFKWPEMDSRMFEGLFQFCGKTKYITYGGIT